LLIRESDEIYEWSKPSPKPIILMHFSDHITLHDCFRRTEETAVHSSPRKAENPSLENLRREVGRARKASKTRDEERGRDGGEKRNLKYRRAFSLILSSHCVGE